MPRKRLSFSAFSVLYAIANGRSYGFEIMDATGLPSGAVYPVLTRLERDGFVSSSWEDEERAAREGRPARRYYRIAAPGMDALEASITILRGIGGPRLALPDGGSLE